MNRLLFFLLNIFLPAICLSAIPPEQKAITYYGREYLLLEGTPVADSLKESPYDRLPIALKDKVRQPVWELSKNSAGLSLRFITNSTSVAVKWRLLINKTMNHMAETGIKGLDLYCKMKNDSWQYVNTARPTGKENEFTLITNMNPETREFRIYLPLYDGIEQIEIGIDSAAVIRKPVDKMQKPIVFYGTSITQGGCASRPGMAYPSVISRKLKTSCVNYGFSANGRMEKPIAELLADIDAAFYVIDCAPNMSESEVKTNMVPLVESIRHKKPVTPIVFVENLLYEKSFFDTPLNAELRSKNKQLKAQYQALVKKGVKNIYYIESNNAIGEDHEATVDGVHFTDLGFIRFADYLVSKFLQFQLVKKTK